MPQIFIFIHTKFICHMWIFTLLRFTHTLKITFEEIIEGSFSVECGVKISSKLVLVIKCTLINHSESLSVYLLHPRIVNICINEYKDLPCIRWCKLWLFAFYRPVGLYLRSFRKEKQRVAFSVKRLKENHIDFVLNILIPSYTE